MLSVAIGDRKNAELRPKRAGIRILYSEESRKPSPVEATHRNSALSPSVMRENGGASIQPYAGLPRLFFSFTEGDLLARADWYYNFVYPRERERGLDYLEDLYSPFAMTFDLRAGEPVRIVDVLQGRCKARLGL